MVIAKSEALWIATHPRRGRISGRHRGGAFQQDGVQVVGQRSRGLVLKLPNNKVVFSLQWAREKIEDMKLKSFLYVLAVATFLVLPAGASADNPVNDVAIADVSVSAVSDPSTILLLGLGLVGLAGLSRRKVRKK